MGMIKKRGKTKKSSAGGEQPFAGQACAYRGILRETL